MVLKHTRNGCTQCSTVTLQRSEWIRACQHLTWAMWAELVPDEGWATHIKVLLAKAIAVHGGAQQPALALLRSDHHSPAAVPKKNAGGCKQARVSCLAGGLYRI